MTSSWLEDYLAEHDTWHTHTPHDNLTWPRITGSKQTAYLLVSDELLMDAGVIPDTRPPRKPPSRRERFRWWRQDKREHLAQRLYERLSGQHFPNPED